VKSMILRKVPTTRSLKEASEEFSKEVHHVMTSLTLGIARISAMGIESRCFAQEQYEPINGLEILSYHLAYRHERHHPLTLIPKET